MFSFLVPGGGAPKIDGQWRGPTQPRMLHMPKNDTAQEVGVYAR